jgi:hypothetical protein
MPPRSLGGRASIASLAVPRGGVNRSSAVLGFSVPIARRAMRRALAKYFSMCNGDTVNTSPMLSNP